MRKDVWSQNTHTDSPNEFWVYFNSVLEKHQKTEPHVGYEALIDIINNSP